MPVSHAANLPAHVAARDGVAQDGAAKDGAAKARVEEKKGEQGVLMLF